MAGAMMVVASTSALAVNSNSGIQYETVMHNAGSSGLFMATAARIFYAY